MGVEARVLWIISLNLKSLILMALRRDFRTLRVKFLTYVFARF